MKYVGDALEGTRNTLIGIATWGIITQNECLINNEERFNEYTVRSSFYNTGAYLDHNHSHFLLVDSGLSKFGGEIKWRSDFEKKIIVDGTTGNYCIFF